VSESIDIFRLQQEIAHRNDLKTTIQMTYSSLFNEECIELVKNHHEEYGDEIGHTFLGLNCKEFREKFHSKELAIWLFPMDLKQEIVVDSFERFKDVFGFYPTSTGSYFMDAELIRFIKEKLSDGESGHRHLLRGGSENLSAHQLLLVHADGRIPLDGLDPIEAEHARHCGQRRGRYWNRCAASPIPGFARRHGQRR
jgi:hypothetical protein